MEQVEQKKELPDFKNLHGGLEILVQLAEKGDIDPWDIDIIDVTDKYLTALDKSPRENLLNAGRAIFYASVLLRLKSDILLNISNETLLASQQTENFFPEDQILSEDDELRIDITKLESFIVRSSIGKQQRKRKILLSDLIFALQQAEEEEERRATRAKLRAERALSIVTPEDPYELFELTREEDIDEVVTKVEAVIEEHLTTDKPITLSFLAEILNNKAKPFIALLFLAHSQKVVLEQKEFYDEVFIHKGGTILEEPKDESEEAKEHERKRKTRKPKNMKDKMPIHKKKEEELVEVAVENTNEEAKENNEQKVIEMSEISNKEVINDGNSTGEPDVNKSGRDTERDTGADDGNQ